MRSIVLLVSFCVCFASDPSMDMSSTSSIGNEEDSVVFFRPIAHPAAGKVIPETTQPYPVIYDDAAEIEYRPASFHPLALRRYRNSYYRRCADVWCEREKLAYLAFLVSLITALSLVIYFRQ